MPLQKYEEFLEPSIKQFVILSKFNFPWSDDVWCVKKQTLMLSVAQGPRHRGGRGACPTFLPCKKNKNDIFFHYIALFQVLTALLFYDVV